MYYRIKAKCDKCGNEWTTRKKENPDPPVRCKKCGSTKTRALDAWKVDKPLIA